MAVIDWPTTRLHPPEPRVRQGAHRRPGPRTRHVLGHRATTTFDPMGNRLTKMVGGATTTSTYNAANELTLVTPPTGPATTLTHDAAGNRTGRTQDGVETTWTYDAANRLTGQQRSGEAATFVYDAMGNVLVKAHEGAAPVTMAYDAANQVTTAQQGAAMTTLTHDAAGNLAVENAGGALTTNTWDGENRLTAVAFPDGTASAYTYAPDGLRSSAQEAGGASTTFVFDGEDYLQERSAGGVVRYVTVGGEVVAEKRDGARRLYVPDPLGSTVALVNAAGAVSDTFRHWPYGEEAARTGSTPTPFRYVGTAGYYRDRLASIYVRARHYRPDLARWASADPLGWDGGDFNLYRYVANRPTVSVDPSGLALKIIGCEGLGAGGRTHESWIREMLRRLCSNGASAMHRVDACLSLNCTAPGVRADCMSAVCDPTKEVTIRCRERNDGSTCKPGVCASTSGVLIPWTVTLCPDTLKPTSRCSLLGCVLLHEFIHRCGICHSWSRTPGCRNRNEDGESDCHCFNCIREAWPQCDGYYADRGDHRLRDQECDRAVGCLPSRGVFA